MTPPVTVSVVSHGHGGLVSRLLADLTRCPEVYRVLLTLNIPEPQLEVGLPDCVRILKNSHPKGFGANHNAAFKYCETPFFAVVNPDITMEISVFPELLTSLSNPGVALCAPSVINVLGAPEDSVRQFPTPVGLLRKALGGHDGRLTYDSKDRMFCVPWVAGMFMLFHGADFRDIHGFDEDYFLYYEDVDLCARLWKHGRSVVLCPTVHVTHDARRASRRSLRHMSWHARSMIRFLIKHPRHSFPITE